jgi:hypothetical protein
MSKIEMIQHARKMAAIHPDKKNEIFDYVYLAIDEIDEGGSEIHETSLAIESINQCVNEN